VFVRCGGKCGSQSVGDLLGTPVAVLLREQSSR
jgi:hypothetical protein